VATRHTVYAIQLGLTYGHSKLLRSAISAVFIRVCELTLVAGNLATVEPIKELGMRSSPNHQFKVVLRQNSMGGGTDMFVMKGEEPSFYAGDVSGYFWVHGILVYSSLPLYGKGGTYTYDPTMEMRSSLVDGKENEYFELKSYSSDTNKVAYYYSDDIKQLDIATLKASNNAVREVLMPTRG
jgi:hypothetical protein